MPSLCFGWPFSASRSGSCRNSLKKDALASDGDAAPFRPERLQDAHGETIPDPAKMRLVRLRGESHR
jgi:hypothetical protein